MVSYGMLRRVALVRATWRNIPEDTILHGYKQFGMNVYIKLVMIMVLNFATSKNHTI
jgi:hypothetical protein